MTLELLLWLHCSTPGRCLLEYMNGPQSQHSPEAGLSQSDPHAIQVMDVLSCLGAGDGGEFDQWHGERQREIGILLPKTQR